MPTPTYDEFCRLASGVSVPRETFDRLVKFSEIFLKWQNSINLVAPGEVDQLWQRHIIDSVQLQKYIPPGSEVIDFGTGGGFPGLIISILGYDVTLVESDQKKSIFLAEASLFTGCGPIILNKRIEDLGSPKFDVVTSRACASLDKLLHMSSPLMNEKTFCLFLKGKNYDGEIKVAKEQFDFNIEIHPSITDPSGVVLKISNLRST